MLGSGVAANDQDKEETEQPNPIGNSPNNDYPLSDQSNIGKWVLNASGFGKNLHKNRNQKYESK